MCFHVSTYDGNM